MFSRLNRSLVMGRRLSSDTRMLQSAAGDDRILLSNLSKVRGLSNVLMIMLTSLRIVRYDVALPAIVATIRSGSSCLIAGNSCARLGSQRSCSVLDVGFLAMRLKLPELAFTPDISGASSPPAARLCACGSTHSPYSRHRNAPSHLIDLSAAKVSNEVCVPLPFSANLSLHLGAWAVQR